ncbi:MAG TPA: 3-methyl-2-oxobutanoate hydroxymethyltransferase, partial [Verrucomicrobiae bacterium]|nr:3-methyl-2-oxobutanoate hydroxymethyltransferase [Verrucomicrobiae bacterium]
FAHKKSVGEKITILTAYDYPTARLLDEAGIDGILVGDSVGNVILGYDTTIPVTMDEMVHHTKAVARGSKGALIIGDMPFLTYHTGTEDALRNAGRFLQEGGAQAVKLEGGSERAEVIKSLVQAGIPVMGHLGLTPQSVHQLGGFKVQGRTEAAAKKLLEDAMALEQAGVFAIVLECIPAGLAKRVTDSVNIPTIGIGAGPACDGQVLVTQDMLGLNGADAPKFVKQFCNLKDLMLAGIRAYSEEVKTGEFPAPEQTFQPLEQGEIKKLY